VSARAPAHVGEKIRALRQAKGYTLAQLATLAGVSPSFLSMLETGKTNVGVPRLQAIAAAFGLSAADLLPGTDAQALIHTVRRGEAPALKGFASGVGACMLTRDLYRRIQPVLMTLEPGARHANAEGHPGEEFLYILRGRVQLLLDGDEAVTLEPGDSAYYPSALPHAYANVGKEVAELLTMSTPPKPV